MGVDEYRLIIGIADNPRDRAIFEAGQTWASIESRELREKIIDALQDAVCGLRYIRSTYGDMYGVGWDRVEAKYLELEPILSPKPPAGSP
jgi:hypothetical protein